MDRPEKTLMPFSYAIFSTMANYVARSSTQKGSDVGAGNNLVAPFGGSKANS
jgi:hypothetical protein